MEAKLVVVGGDAQAGEYQLKLPTIVGRSRRADLKLPHPLVSRQHCEIYEADGVLMVRDLGSLNGTFVGESRISEETAIEPGHLLTIGSVTFRAVYGGASDLPASQLEQTAVKGKPGKKPAGAKKRDGDKEGSGEKPAEIELTHQAGGLAALEMLRGTEAEGGEAAIMPDEAESSEDFDFNWLDEGEAEAEPVAREDLETAKAPAPSNRKKSDDSDDDNDGADDAHEATLDLGDLDVEVEDTGGVDPAKVAEIADEEAAHPSSDATPTIRVEEALTGEEENEPASGHKAPAQEAAAEEDDLDDFFKSLQ